MKFIDYLKNTKLELKHVAWPTRRQALHYTLLVVGVSVAVAAFLFIFDLIFTGLLEKFVI